MKTLTTVVDGNNAKLRIHFDAKWTGSLILASGLSRDLVGLEGIGELGEDRAKAAAYELAKAHQQNMTPLDQLVWTADPGTEMLREHLPKN